MRLDKNLTTELLAKVKRKGASASDVVAVEGDSASVQVRLSAFSARDDGAAQALGVLRKEVAATPKVVSLRTLLAWLYMERKDYNSALTEYRAIDELKSAKGQELFTFAQRALQEKAYHAASGRGRSPPAGCRWSSIRRWPAVSWATCAAP